MVGNRALSSLSLGFSLGCLFWAACGGSSGRAIGSIIGDALSVAYTGAASGLAAGTVQAAIDETVGRIGDLQGLTTQTKASAVAAINEVNGKTGDLTQLATVTKTSLVAAINEVKAAAASAGAAQPVFVLSGQGIPGNETFYAFANQSVDSNIATRQARLPRAGQALSLTVESSGTTNAAASVAVTLVVNGAPTALTVTFAGGDPAQVKTSTTPVTLAAGDRVTIGFANAGSAFSDAAYNVTLELR